MDIKNMIKDKLPLTLGDMIEIADRKNISPVEVVLIEAEIQANKTREEILDLTLKEFDHNLRAVEIGLTDGSSLLLGETGAQLNAIDGFKLFEDEFVDKALVYTIAAQVGNHVIGLNPCAGTGDPCPYTGFIKAMIDLDYEKERIAGIAALILKIGAMFRVGKTSTGCNMEGFGAGATAIAAATTELKGGSARDMERAMVLAISPTIAVPCTPRVMVPALCATHIGGAILVGHMSAGLAVKTDIEVNVPIDVMLAMASEIHPISAEHVVPTVVEYMQPFFKTKEPVENLVEQSIKDEEELRIEKTLKKAREVSQKLAEGTNSIIDTLGEAVVGGSSQAVGSPTNTARIAHYLAKEVDENIEINRVKIELYPELFARRGINVPGILMAAVFGASTSDGERYKTSVEEVVEKGIEVDIAMAQEHQLQRVTLYTNKGEFMVDALNRGGGRLVLRDATPSKEKAKSIAQKLGIVLAE